jgi:hypothetical protein
LGSITYFLTCDEILHNLPKPTRKPIPSLRYYVIKHHGSTSLLEGYCSCPKLLNTPAIPLTMYPKNTLGSITYILKLGKILHSPTKNLKGMQYLTL